jgi:hypothetical protein
MLDLESDELRVDRVVESFCCVGRAGVVVENGLYVSRGQWRLHPYYCCAYYCRWTRGAHGERSDEQLLARDTCLLLLIVLLRRQRRCPQTGKRVKRRSGEQ